MKLVFYRTKSLLRSERYSWFLQSANGQKLGRSEGFTNREDCEANAALVTCFGGRPEIRIERLW